MSNPILQHYIPKSYLKNFAIHKGNKVYLVDTIMRGKNEQVKTLPTKTICAEKNIYTFDDTKPGDPYALEKFYAVEVDAIYPKVYDTLVNSTIMNIPKDTKREILNTLLSLKFRRPEPLQAVVSKLEWMFDRMSKHPHSAESMLNYSIEGSKYSFYYKDLASEMEIRRKELKENWLIKHFAQWQEFVEYKIACGLDVIEVPDDVPIITSDNPVSVFDLMGKRNVANPFDPTNMLEIPLDRTHYLVIHPNVTSENTYQRIHRSKRDKYFAAGVNRKVQENSDKRIIAYPGDLDAHFASQVELDVPNKENIAAMNDMISKTMQAVELSKVMKKNNDSIFNQEVADKVREMRKNSVMNGDPVFESLIVELAKKGFFTV